MQPLVGGVGVGTRRWWSLPTSQVVFITEYVSSGSLKQFLKKTKKNHKAMNARVWGVGWGGVRARMELGAVWDRDGEGRGAVSGTGTGSGRGTSGPAAFPAPASHGARPPPGLEALVHADPVRTQVRVGAGLSSCPAVPPLPGEP